MLGATPGKLVAADFNGDGKPDLAVVNAFRGGGTISILLGNGDGTFQHQAGFVVGSTPQYVAVGDFAEKGKPDLAVASKSGNAVTVLINETR